MKSISVYRHAIESVEFVASKKCVLLRRVDTHEWVRNIFGMKRLKQVRDKVGWKIRGSFGTEVELDKVGCFEVGGDAFEKAKVVLKTTSGKSYVIHESTDDEAAKMYWEKARQLVVEYGYINIPGK